MKRMENFLTCMNNIIMFRQSIKVKSLHKGWMEALLTINSSRESFSFFFSNSFWFHFSNETLKSLRKNEK